MYDRARAIEILKPAGDDLAERLIERVLDAREEIADDAKRLSYVGEIEAIYEQIGGQFAHVNQMLGSLSPKKEPEKYAEKDSRWLSVSPCQA